MVGGQVLAPGPDHSVDDRSLLIKLDPKAPDGFLVHSFAGDDPIACRDNVRAKLGLPEFAPKKSGNGKTSASGKSLVVAQYVYRAADGTPYLRVNRRAVKKDGFFQKHWTGSAWALGAPPPKTPYRLPELLAAPLIMPVYIAEGEKVSDNPDQTQFRRHHEQRRRRQRQLSGNPSSMPISRTATSSSCRTMTSPATRPRRSP